MQKKPTAEGVVDALKTDGVTAGIAAVTVVGVVTVPVFGWAVGVVGGACLAYRAVKRGLKR